MPRTRPNVPPPALPFVPAVCYRASALASGRLMPIEVRLGHRLLRTIAPDSAEGRRLVREGRVEITAQR